MLTVVAAVMILGIGMPSMAKKSDGYEGCSPGFWKNHLEDWCCYSPDDSFSAIFGAGPDVTLLEALNTGGGGADALGRHAVAALLNASHPDINYPASDAEVIEAVNTAILSDDKDMIEYTKDVLDYLNNLGCTK
jgi:hypothetical protein